MHVETSKNLSPPREVPELAMKQFPVEEPKAKEIPKLQVQKPIEEAPSLDMSKIRLETKPALPTLPPVPKQEEVMFEPKPLPPQPQSIPETIRSEAKKPDDELKYETKIKPDDKLADDNEEKASPFIQRHPVPPPKGMYDGRTENDIEKRRQTFFSQLKDHFENRSPEHLAMDTKTILDSMRTYQEEIMQKENALKQKAALDSVLAEKIMTLELLEEGWYLLRREIDTKQMLLLEKEKLIDEQLIELKGLMEKERKIDTSMPKVLPHDKWFHLKDGRKISSIDELKNVLSNIEDHVFSHHVNENKNDFSSWINHVFNDEKLALKLKGAKTKEELIRFLETA